MSNPNPNPVENANISINIIDVNNPEIAKIVASLKDAKRPKKPSWTIKLKDQVLYDQKFCEYQIQLYLWEIANNVPHRPTVGTYLKVAGTALLAIGGAFGVSKALAPDKENNELIPETTSDNDVIE